jgi:hypothetical protein
VRTRGGINRLCVCTIVVCGFCLFARGCASDNDICGSIKNTQAIIVYLSTRTSGDTTYSVQITDKQTASTIAKKLVLIPTEPVLRTPHEYTVVLESKAGQLVFSLDRWLMIDPDGGYYETPVLFYESIRQITDSQPVVSGPFPREWSRRIRMAHRHARPTWK